MQLWANYIASESIGVVDAILVKVRMQVHFSMQLSVTSMTDQNRSHASENEMMKKAKKLKKNEDLTVNNAKTICNCNQTPNISVIAPKLPCYL